MAKDKKLTPEGEKVQKREYALINLSDEYITNVASAGISKPEEGKMPKYGLILSGLYNETVMNAPDQNAYEKLMREDLLSETGSLNKQRLIAKATQIIIDSIKDIKVDDIFELLGSKKGIKSDYKGKYVGETSEEDSKMLITSYATSMVNQKAESFLVRERKTIVGGLEKKFCEDKKE